MLNGQAPITADLVQKNPAEFEKRLSTILNQLFIEENKSYRLNPAIESALSQCLHVMPLEMMHQRINGESLGSWLMLAAFLGSPSVLDALEKIVKYADWNKKIEQGPFTGATQLFLLLGAAKSYSQAKKIVEGASQTLNEPHWLAQKDLDWNAAVRSDCYQGQTPFLQLILAIRQGCEISNLDLYHVKPDWNAKMRLGGKERILFTSYLETVDYLHSINSKILTRSDIYELFNMYVNLNSIDLNQAVTTDNFPCVSPLYLLLQLLYRKVCSQFEKDQLNGGRILDGYFKTNIITLFRRLREKEDLDWNFKVEENIPQPDGTSLNVVLEQTPLFLMTALLMTGLCEALDMWQNLIELAKTRALNWGSLPTGGTFNNRSPLEIVAEVAANNMQKNKEHQAWNLLEEIIPQLSIEARRIFDKDLITLFTKRAQNRTKLDFWLELNHVRNLYRQNPENTKAIEKALVKVIKSAEDMPSFYNPALLMIKLFREIGDYENAAFWLEKSPPNCILSLFEVVSLCFEQKMSAECAMHADKIFKEIPYYYEKAQCMVAELKLEELRAHARRNKANNTLRRSEISHIYERIWNIQGGNKLAQELRRFLAHQYVYGGVCGTTPSTEPDPLIQDIAVPPKAFVAALDKFRRANKLEKENAKLKQELDSLKKQLLTSKEAPTVVSLEEKTSAQAGFFESEADCFVEDSCKSANKCSI